MIISKSVQTEKIKYRPDSQIGFHLCRHIADRKVHEGFASPEAFSILSVACRTKRQFSALSREVNRGAGYLPVQPIYRLVDDPCKQWLELEKQSAGFLP